MIQQNIPRLMSEEKLQDKVAMRLVSALWNTIAKWEGKACEHEQILVLLLQYILGERILHDEYFLLGPVPSCFKCIIGSPSLHTSGDIYHILAYLILARAFDSKLPEVLIAYDSTDTELNARRSVGFAGPPHEFKFG